MKPPVLTAIIVSTLVSLVACGEEAGHPADSHGGELENGLRLDNGKKWQANEATHVGMGNMQELLTDFEASAAKNHHALGDSLRAEANVIIQKCTMTGEPHHQLHLLLNPMLEIIEKLESGRGGDAEIESVRTHLKNYYSHFEL